MSTVDSDQTAVTKVTMLDNIKEFLLRFAASGLLPGSWFIPNRPKPAELAARAGTLSLEVVSHCWQYSHFLAYQLASIVKYPPTSCQLTFTLFYSEQDNQTVALLAKYQQLQVANVTWNFQALATPKLLRRAIGRNQAAKASTADWVWFTDCDVLFFEKCFDSLALQLQNRQQLLVFPRTLKATELLEADATVLTEQVDLNADISGSLFNLRHYKKATGPIQIVHGDVARQCGYCDSLSVYQRPKPVWVKTYEDRAFRWLLGTDGVPIEIDNLYLIRHVQKGRYQPKSRFSALRRMNRRIKAALFNK